MVTLLVIIGRLIATNDFVGHLMLSTVYFVVIKVQNILLFLFLFKLKYAEIQLEMHHMKPMDIIARLVRVQNRIRLLFISIVLVNLSYLVGHTA